MVHGAREAQMVAVKVVVRTIGHVFGLFKAQMPDHEESALMGTDSQRVRFLNE
jgi:hypothetical protein